MQKIGVLIPEAPLDVQIIKDIHYKLEEIKMSFLRDQRTINECMREWSCWIESKIKEHNK